MNKKELDEIRERVKRATKEPWKVRKLFGADFGDGFVQAPREKPKHSYDIEILGEDVTQYGTREGDLHFIAHSRADIPALCGFVERAVKVIYNLKHSIPTWTKAIAESDKILNEWEGKDE
jgi:hypothetical protein